MNPAVGLMAKVRGPVGNFAATLNKPLPTISQLLTRARTPIVTVDDFMAQAQARLNAVKAEYGNVEAYNMASRTRTGALRSNPADWRATRDLGTV